MKSRIKKSPVTSLFLGCCNIALSVNQRLLFVASVFLLSWTNIFGAGQVISFAPCPRVYGMPEFNITRYEGKWFEVEKFWFIFEATAACVSVEYLDNTDGTFSVEINQIDRLSGKKMINPGVTRYLSRDGSADFVLDLLITQVPFPFRFSYPYIVIDTDYESYTIKFRCQRLGPLSLQNIWILSRNRTFTQAARKKVYHKLRTIGIDSTRLTISDQGSCPPY